MPSNQDPQNSGRFSRPIDAPSLPPWSKGRADDDETPTLSGEDLPETQGHDVTEWVQTLKPVAAAPEDPRELARRLAEEAKKRLGQTPQPADRLEDPRELAKRLAEEAKQRMAAQKELAPQPLPAAKEDPRELARRLAEEAKQRLTPAPVPEAKKRKTPKRRQTFTPSPAPLSERTATRPMSAAEALARAREEEKRRATAMSPGGTPEPAPARKAPKPAPPPEPLPEPAPPVVAAPAPAPVAPVDVFAELLPGAQAAPAVTVGNADVFRALWRAHRARAVHEKDLPLVATASVLLDAIERVAPGRLVATRVTIDGAVWAAWADLDRKVLLGLAQPADVYLAGL